MKIIENTVNPEHFPVGTEVKWEYIRGSYYLRPISDKLKTVMGCTARKDKTCSLAGKKILINDKRGILKIE